MEGVERPKSGRKADAIVYADATLQGRELTLNQPTTDSNLCAIPLDRATTAFEATLLPKSQIPSRSALPS